MAQNRRMWLGKFWTRFFKNWMKLKFLINLQINLIQICYRIRNFIQTMIFKIFILSVRKIFILLFFYDLRKNFLKQLNCKYDTWYQNVQKHSFLESIWEFFRYKFICSAVSTWRFIFHSWFLKNFKKEKKIRLNLYFLLQSSMAETSNFKPSCYKINFINILK
jgi:hypothetical protein